MFTVVAPHVYQFSSHLDGPEGSLDYRLRLAHESHHRPVRCLAGVNVQESRALDCGYRVGNAGNDGRVTAFGEVGNTFEQSRHRVIQASEIDRVSRRQAG